MAGVFGAHWVWQGCLELIGCDRGVWSSLGVTGMFGTLQAETKMVHVNCMQAFKILLS